MAPYFSVGCSPQNVFCDFIRSIYDLIKSQKTFWGEQLTEKYGAILSKNLFYLNLTHKYDLLIILVFINT